MHFSRAHVQRTERPQSLARQPCYAPRSSPGSSASPLGPHPDPDRSAPDDPRPSAPRLPPRTAPAVTPRSARPARHRHQRYSRWLSQAHQTPRPVCLNCELPTNGLSNTRISVWLLSSSSTFLRLPNRVFRLITRYSRNESIGGFVT